MRRVFIALVALVTLVACSEQNTQDTSAQENALANLATGGGYALDGSPVYDGTRWTVRMIVPECTLNGRRIEVLLGGEEAPKEVTPTQYTVLEVDDIPLEELTDVDGRKLTAQALAQTLGASVQLGC